jgi:hypothetical protein
VGKAIGLIEDATRDNDTRLALKIGRIEQKLDQAYKKLLKDYTAELKRRKNTEDLISALFVAHYVEQMGDALLSLSEAVISCNLGQPIDIDRYHSLRASVEQLADDDAFPEIEVKRIAETRSGSGISAISVPDGEEEGYVAIFKDGEKRKLKEERAGVESWHEIFPGLAPRILSYKKRGQSALLLIEHLAGLTFEQILLHEPPALVKQTLNQLGRRSAPSGRRHAAIHRYPPISCASCPGDWTRCMRFTRNSGRVSARSAAMLFPLSTNCY